MICNSNFSVSHTEYKKKGVAAYNTTNMENYVLVDCSRAEENIILLKLYKRNSTYTSHMIPLNLNNEHLMICAKTMLCTEHFCFMLLKKVTVFSIASSRNICNRGALKNRSVRKQFKTLKKFYYKKLPF